jgi:UDP-N-acetylmuramoyl-L-alanyl-D-glutamate--2,6-diaminopimelate ligase
MNWQRWEKRVKINFEYKNYKYLTDNTKELDENTLFLSTAQNKIYQNNSKIKEKITPKELIKIWNLEDIKIVGVTGTNGKTTTTAIIYSLLIDLGKSAALQGTRGVFANDEVVEKKHMTTPSILETLFNIKRAKDAFDIEFFVMEVSSHAIDQNRIEDLNFALKIHTNVTRDHLDYHKTVSEYQKVKSQFFLDDSKKLINKDEEKSIQYNKIGAYTYAVEEPATFKILAYSIDSSGISALVKYHQEEETFFSPMMGLFNLYNILAGIAAVKILTNEPLSKICEMVENFGGVSGRMEVVSQNPTIIVDFAHTDDGIYRVLDSLKDRELVVVFGAGGDRDKSKRARMGAVAGKFAKKIYVTSDNPRSEVPEKIIEDILVGLKGKRGVFPIVDRKEAIKRAITELKDGEILLILGKGDESYQEIAGEKYPFDDRVVVREILEEINS